MPESLNTPSFVYPNGGEIVFDRELSVSWKRPAKPSIDNDPVWYELFFTDSWDDAKEPEWVQIATLPSTTDGFVWKIPFSIRSNKCRLGIRSRDHSGQRSVMNLSADNFTIQEKSLLAPAVFHPVDGGSYHQYVQIVLDYSGVSGTYSQRALYQIYYSSLSNGIDWTPVRQNIPIGTQPFFWDIRDIPPGSDYSLKVILLDDKGNSSIPVFIRDMQLAPLDYFLLDTTPPVGKVSIENNLDYTKDRNLILRLEAFDETTGVKSVILKQVFDGEETFGTEQEMANIKSWYITGDVDGSRCIQSLFKDFGENQVSTEETGKFFRRYIYNANEEVTAFIAVKNGNTLTLYTAFGGDSPKLYVGKTSKVDLEDEASCLCFFDGNIYVATKNEENQGKLNKLEGSDITEVYAIGSDDSSIVSMAVYNSVLYFGLQNGDLYSFDGASVSFVSSFGSQIQTLFSDGNVLYVFVENDENIRTYDGTTFGTAGVSNGYFQV
jgi:hypothetical protein